MGHVIEGLHGEEELHRATIIKNTKVLLGIS